MIKLIKLFCGQFPYLDKLQDIRLIQWQEWKANQASRNSISSVLYFSKELYRAMI